MLLVIVIGFSVQLAAATFINCKPVYHIINWIRKPVKACIFNVGCIFLALIVFTVFWGIYKCKMCCGKDEDEVPKIVKEVKVDQPELHPTYSEDKEDYGTEAKFKDRRTHPYIEDLDSQMPTTDVKFGNESDNPT